MRIAREAAEVPGEVILRLVGQDPHGHAVERGVAERPGEVVAVGIDVGDVDGSARGSRDAKGAGVGEEVQHALPRRALSHEQTGLGGVEVEAEVMGGIDANLELQAALHAYERRGVRPGAARGVVGRRRDVRVAELARMVRRQVRCRPRGRLAARKISEPVQAGRPLSCSPCATRCELCLC